ncbi:hypothetical protein VUR80DRAFT_4313 [Thermomyces stellatus]
METSLFVPNVLDVWAYCGRLEREHGTDLISNGNEDFPRVVPTSKQDGEAALACNMGQLIAHASALPMLQDAPTHGLIEQIKYYVPRQRRPGVYILSYANSKTPASLPTYPPG